MGMVVRTNVMAMNANRQLGVNNTLVGKSLEKLSSGFRINRAADDASGLAISEKMKAQIKGLETASANSQDGISLVQTAEGGAAEIHDMLNRMTELATKSANGTIQNEVDREAIQKEVNDLNDEITRIAKSTNFNGINLLDGNLSAKGGSSSDALTNLKDTAVNFLASTATANAITGAQTKDSKNVTRIGIAAGATADALTVTYQDKNGQNQSVTLTVGGSGTTPSSLATLKTDLTTQLENIANGQKVDGSGVLDPTSASDMALKEFASQFDIKVGDDGTNAYLEFSSKATGESKVAVTSVSSSVASHLGTVAADGTVTLDTGATGGAGITKKTSVMSTAHNKGYEITLDSANLANKDKIKVGDKTFQIVATAAEADKVEKGVIAVVVAAGDRATAGKAASAVVQAMKDNGINSASNVDIHGNATNKIFIGDTSEISVQQKGSMGISSSSDGAHIANQQETGSSYGLTIDDANFFGGGAALVKAGDVLKLKFEYLDETGAKKTIEMDYEVAEDATNAGDNDDHAAASIVAKLKNNKEFTDKFEISNAAGVLSLKVKDGTGSSAVQVTGLKLSDKAGKDLLTSTTVGNNLNQRAAGTKAGKTLTVTNDIKAGDTVKMGDKTFQFVTNPTDKVADGATAVVLGSNAAASAKNLDKAMQEAFPDLEYNFDAATNKFTFEDKGKDFVVDGGDGTSGGLTLQIGDTGDDFNRVTVSVDDLSAKGIGTAGLKVGEQDDARESIATIKSAINKVSTNRANLGSLQNRLEHTINNLDTTAENMTSANSRIRDTDMAKEMMNYTKMNVLTQAAQAMLAQANQQPQSILQLLQ